MRRHHHPTECDWLSLRALEVIKDGKVNVAKGTHAAPEITVTADGEGF